MRNPNEIPDVIPDASTVLGAYVSEAAKGKAHRKRIAMQLWRTLTPAERLEHQCNARSIAGHNLLLGAEYTQAVLLFIYVQQRSTHNGLQTSRRTVRNVDIIVSGGDVLDPQPAI